jgi:hypothetical protein
MNTLQLEPLAVSIQREGKEIRRVEIPDPRNEFCRQFNNTTAELDWPERAAPLPRPTAIGKWAVAIIKTSDAGWTPGGDDPDIFEIQYVWAEQLPRKTAEKVAGLLNKDGSRPAGEFAHVIMQLLANQCRGESDAEPACVAGA